MQWAKPEFELIQLCCEINPYACPGMFVSTSSFVMRSSAVLTILALESKRQPFNTKFLFRH